MSNPSPSNLAHSVFQRLLNYAKQNGEEFNLLLSRYALERFLYPKKKPMSATCSNSFSASGKLLPDFKAKKSAPWESCSNT